MEPNLNLKINFSHFKTFYSPVFGYSSFTTIHLAINPHVGGGHCPQTIALATCPLEGGLNVKLKNDSDDVYNIAFCWERLDCCLSRDSVVVGVWFIEKKNYENIEQGFPATL